MGQSFAGQLFNQPPADELERAAIRGLQAGAVPGEQNASAHMIEFAWQQLLLVAYRQADPQRASCRR